MCLLLPNFRSVPDMFSEAVAATVELDYGLQRRSSAACVLAVIDEGVPPGREYTGQGAQDVGLPDGAPGRQRV